MGKTFEDNFSEIQADMVDICMEYVEDRADEIYIYGCYEDKFLTSDYFYKIDGKILDRHKLNDAYDGNEVYDVSDENQGFVLDILNKDIRKIKELCLENEREMPTEIKLIYNVKKNSLKAEYKYENVWSQYENKLPQHVVEEWFEEIKAKNS
ncbi:hypothetical protein [[Clostridium] colinum]|uniref:hypothetical protein n=1 Tax=[Clostridium] colinum TaxID=36835 RepID=UPI0020247917|nr:hypothetical protein [[Clostridium] colinum]